MFMSELGFWGGRVSSPVRVNSEPSAGASRVGLITCETPDRTIVPNSLVLGGMGRRGVGSTDMAS